MHTPNDSMDLTSERPLEVIGRLLDTFLSRTAAGAQVWPFEREVLEKSKEELEEIMKAFVPLIEGNEASSNK